jgi:hypothetical protein
MFCMVDYETARDLLPWDAEINGATTSAIQLAAKRLGTNLVFSRSFDDLEDEQGIVCLRMKDGDAHCAVLVCGMLIDTNGTIWRLDDYLRIYRAQLLSFLKEEQ